MPIRDIALVAVIVALLPVCFARPWIGILVWSWLAYMNPHRHMWGFAYDIPFSQMVGLATLAGFPFAKDRGPFLWTRESALLLALWAWFTFTTFFALYPADAWEQWSRVSKILLMSLLTIPLFQDRQRIRYLLLVIAASIGFYGVKAGLFVFATGGGAMVLGAPGGTFISSNNALALALNMCLPIFFFLARAERHRGVKIAFATTFVLSALAVPFTYSRGGVLGLVVVLALLAPKSRYRVAGIVVLLVAAYVFMSVAPDKFVLRMETLRHYEEDSSAMARLTAWGVGYALARERPITGGGFWVFNHPETFKKYAPGFEGFADAHSIYFNLLGEHGFVGLLLFAALAVSVLAALRRLRSLERDGARTWIATYAAMLRVGIVGYLATGAFLSVAYFDLAYHFFVLAILLREMAARERVAPPVPVNGTVRTTIRPVRWLPVSR
jgi:putative inorganic carbon (hco3(-)) transporter